MQPDVVTIRYGTDGTSYTKEVTQWFRIAEDEFGVPITPGVVLPGEPGEYKHGSISGYLGDFVDRFNPVPSGNPLTEPLRPGWSITDQATYEAGVIALLGALPPSQPFIAPFQTLGK